MLILGIERHDTDWEAIINDTDFDFAPGRTSQDLERKYLEACQSFSTDDMKQTTQDIASNISSPRKRMRTKSKPDMVISAVHCNQKPVVYLGSDLEIIVEKGRLFSVKKLASTAGGVRAAEKYLADCKQRLMDAERLVRILGGFVPMDELQTGPNFNHTQGGVGFNRQLKFEDEDGKVFNMDGLTDDQKLTLSDVFKDIKNPTASDFENARRQLESGNTSGCVLQ